MRKKIQVKHTHRYTKSENILYEGYAICNDYDGYMEITYHESDDTKVVMYAYDNYMIIERYGEVQSQLHLHRNKRSKCPMKSEYGSFEIEVTTFAYKKQDNAIMVEYDIESGNPDKDGFKIEIEVKEVAHEYN